MDLMEIAFAKAIGGGSGQRVIDCSGTDPVFVGMNLTPADFYNTIIIYSNDGDWLRVCSTATNLNTITFRDTESGDNLYFYYEFDDGCIHKHVG